MYLGAALRLTHDYAAAISTRGGTKMLISIYQTTRGHTSEHCSVDTCLHYEVRSFQAIYGEQ